MNVIADVSNEGWSSERLIAIIFTFDSSPTVYFRLSHCLSSTTTFSINQYPRDIVTEIMTYPEGPLNGATCSRFFMNMQFTGEKAGGLPVQRVYWPVHGINW